MPYNVVTVQAGQMVRDITSVWDVLTLRTSARLCVLAAIAFVPGWLARRRRAGHTAAVRS